jgi:hypothetical protein
MPARTYTLADGVRVTADVPADWTEDTTPRGPRFKVADLRGPGGPAITYLNAPGATPAARLAWAIDQQYTAAELAAAKRTDHPDGRVWIASTGKGGVDARMFLTPATGVVMVVIALLPDQADRLATLQPFAESVRLAK